MATAGQRFRLHKGAVPRAPQPTWTYRHNHATQIATALVLALCYCSWCVAQDGSGSADGASVAMNQPVSINGTQAPPQVESAPAHPAPGEQSAGSASGLRRPRRFLHDSGIAGVGQTVYDADGGTSLPLSKPTPWYRTGFGALAVVLLLIGAAVWILRRWVPAARSAESRLVRVVARANLSPKHSAALVRVGRRFVLVGMSGERVNTLCEISDPEEAAELSFRTESTTVRQDAEGFERLLIEEAADYRRPTIEQIKETELRVAGAARKPLVELLQRLRSLQSGRRAAG